MFHNNVKLHVSAVVFVVVVRNWVNYIYSFMLIPPSRRCQKRMKKKKRSQGRSVGHFSVIFTFGYLGA